MDDNNGWLPIETAPRDGTEILAWDGEVTDVIWWDGLAWDDGRRTVHPTNWMPLPEPPL
jgi:hypothetical protein